MITSSKKLTAVQLLQKGKSVHAVMEQTGLSNTTVRKLRISLGIPAKPVGNPPTHAESVFKLAAVIYEQAPCKRTWAEIASFLGSGMTEATLSSKYRRKYRQRLQITQTIQAEFENHITKHKP